MSAIESAFVNTVIIRERDKISSSSNSTGTNTPAICEQQDTMAKKTFASKMWMNRSVAQDKSGYCILFTMRCSTVTHDILDRARIRRHLRNRSTRISRWTNIRACNAASLHT
jgi:hypothetical protein